MKVRFIAPKLEAKYATNARVDSQYREEETVDGQTLGYANVLRLREWQGDARRVALPQHVYETKGLEPTLVGSVRSSFVSQWKTVLVSH